MSAVVAAATLRSVGIVGEHGGFAASRRRREQREAQRDAEKELRQPGVADRDGRRQEQQHRDPAEEALKDDGAERGEAEPPHPRSRVDPPRPDREDDGQEPHRARDQPVAVLVENPAHPSC